MRMKAVRLATALLLVIHIVDVATVPITISVNHSRPVKMAAISSVQMN